MPWKFTCSVIVWSVRNITCSIWFLSFVWTIQFSSSIGETTKISIYSANFDVLAHRIGNRQFELYWKFTECIWLDNRVIRREHASKANDQKAILHLIPGLLARVAVWKWQQLICFFLLPFPLLFFSCLYLLDGRLFCGSVVARTWLRPCQRERECAHHSDRYRRR